MAGRKCLKSSKYVAKLADTRASCAFCRRNVDEETTYGKLYSIGDIYCHYFCVLLSCCLIQKGKDEEGLFGFMYPDILAEIERSKKHRCSYCGVEGATLGCSVTQCKKQFHLPCGREKKAVSLYFGNYKSFCEKHAPKQKIPDVIMSKAKSRLARIRKGNRGTSKKTEDDMEEPESVCVICYEAVDGFPTTETFWPPCCARDAWFHRSCLQRMALSAGVYYLKCPLCNDKDAFYSAVLEQGYFIPDRDAAWELEQNAFSEIYERPVECRAVECKCTKGRNYDANSGIWDIKLCVLCGGPGSHQACLSTEFYVCTVCSPAAPDQSHLAAIDAVSLPSQEQTTQRVPTGPVMPSRMSLRRTKPKPLYTLSSSSQNVRVKAEIETNAVKSNTDLSREELNLKTPRRSTTNIPTKENLEDKSLTPLKLLKQPENEFLSPLKLLRQGLNEKISSTEVEKIILDRKIIEEMREKFRKPKPASVKRKIVGEILEGLLDYMTSEQNVELKKSPEKIQETPEDATKNEDKENVLDITMNHSSNIQNEDLSVQFDISKNPEIISEISEQNDSKLQEQNILFSINRVSEPKISEPLEENILQQSILEQLIVCENANLTPKKVILENDSSNNSSPFQLPPEFIAESSNSLPTIDTPKKLKKINIENDSMEISENNQIVNIDLVKIENSSLKDFKIPEEKCAFKLSPLNKDIMKKNLDIDLESFKNHYLNEVDRKFYCKFDHNHDNVENSQKKIRSAIDFAMDALKKPPKRKLPASDNVASKKRKTTKKVRRTKKQHIVRTIDKECNKNVAGEKSDDKNVSDEKRSCKKRKVVKNKDKSDDNECQVEKRRRAKKFKNNHKTELSIRNRNINLKIRFKSEELNLKISKPKTGRKSKNVTPKVLKQYVLQYPINKTSPQDCIARPDADVTPMKRKYNVKCEKSTDNLKQTSIANFFKVSPKA